MLRAAHDRSSHSALRCGAGILWILLAATLSGQARAQTATALGPEDETASSRWLPLPPEEAKRVNEKAAQPAKVRLGLKLTPFKKVVTRGRDGAAETRYVPVDPLRHTLRARLNETNHFFVGDWHVETVPTKWVKKTRHYEVRLNIYRRYGAFGQLEENVGAVDLAGTLDQQPDNVHVLVGVARQRLRDKLGNPYLDVVAGFAPAKAAGPKISAAEGQTPAPAAVPSGNPGEAVRGRF
jgi:hypothetical protein